MTCARSVLLLGLVIAATGCLPLLHTETRTLSRTMSEPIVDRVGALQVVTKVVDATVEVTATWPRWCHRDVFEEYEVHEERKAEVVGTSNGDTWGAYLLVAVIIAYPVGIADAVITLVGVVADGGGTTTRRTEKVNVLPSTCPIPAADVPLHLTTPSGAVIDGRTDESGSFLYLLGDGDRGGAVTVRADHVAPPARPALPPAAPRSDESAPQTPEIPEKLTSDQVVEGIAPVREDVAACGERSQVGMTVNVRLTVSGEGRVTVYVPDRGSPAAVYCMGRVFARARFPRSRTGAHGVLTFRIPALPAPAPAAFPPGT